MIVEVEVKESALTSRALPQNVNSITVTCTQKKRTNDKNFMLAHI